VTRQYETALRHYGEATTADPNCIPAWLGAARLLREREMWSGCEEKARAGLAVRPDPALRQELALALIGQGRLPDAEQQLEAYRRARPQDQETAKVLSNVLVVRAYAMLGNPAERAAVRRLVDKALSYNPDELKAHLVLGRLAKEEGRLVDAVRHLERAHKLLPTFDDARQLYVESLASLGYEKFVQLDEVGAVAAWQQCFAVAPPDFDSTGIRDRIHAIWQKHEAAGVQHLQAGDRSAAVRAFRRCLELEPEQHWAAWLLVLAVHDDAAADLAEVERWCRQAVAWQQRHGEDSSQQVLMLARTLVKRGQADAGKSVVGDYLKAPHPDAKPQFLAALRSLAGS
jgi:tetratricopeptide (TPR) repeat protein